jgi:thiosulfate dehydrogenase
MKKIIFLIHLLILSSALALSCAPTERASVAPGASPARQAESVAHGGLLYDMWWRVVPGASEPKSDQPLWSLQSTNKRNGSVTWRCKECHGWDYKGKMGPTVQAHDSRDFRGMGRCAEEER